MSRSVKELRASTNMTQKAFACMYGIPLSTLRKWEQGESTPPSYVITLLSRSLPCTSSSLVKIEAGGDIVYYYDESQKAVIDMYGNKITIQEDLKDVKKQNLVIYLNDLFESFYEIQDKFNRDCKYDKQEDILWTV